MMLSLCLILGFVHLVFANDNKEYVVEAEEGKTINITCLEPSVINVTAVMYGRDSKIFPCENENQSRIFVIEKCQYRSFCFLEVNDDNFKDICFGLERLKVKYRCVEALKAFTTTIGATIGVLSSIVVLLTITISFRRYHRLQKDHKRDIEKQKPTQSWSTMANDVTNGNGLQNIYTDIDEERHKAIMTVLLMVKDNYNKCIQKHKAVLERTTRMRYILIQLLKRTMPFIKVLLMTLTKIH